MASIDISEERGVRYLHFGSQLIQGAMRIARPWSLELDYTRAMMAPLLLHPPRRWPRRVLQIGLGAASVTKFLHRHRKQAKITVVEISPQVVAAAAQFFGIPDDPKRIDIEIGDGYEYVMRSKARFDLILVDGFDARGRVGMLDTEPFYAGCRARLEESGATVVNLLGRRRTAQASIARIREAFDDRTWQLPCEAGNVVVLAAIGRRLRRSPEELRSSARALHSDTGLNLVPMVSRLLQKARDEPLVL